MGAEGDERLAGDRALEKETSTGQKLAWRLSGAAGASSLGKLTNEHPQETTTSFVSQSLTARYTCQIQATVKSGLSGEAARYM